jgi:hypothetical protein
MVNEGLRGAVPVAFWLAGVGAHLFAPLAIWLRVL